jgi:hypothetical protein
MKQCFINAVPCLVLEVGERIAVLVMLENMFQVRKAIFALG